MKCTELIAKSNVCHIWPARIDFNHVLAEFYRALPGKLVTNDIIEYSERMQWIYHYNNLTLITK